MIKELKHESNGEVTVIFTNMSSITLASELKARQYVASMIDANIKQSVNETHRLCNLKTQNEKALGKLTK